MTAIPKTYLDEKHLTVKNFVIFLRENKPLLFISFITVLVVFSVKLTNICFGIDTEIHISSDRYLNWMSIGRFGLVALQKLWTNIFPNTELFNPCLATFFGCFFLLCGTLLFCFVIDFFSNNSIKKICYIPFAILFISHQVWTEQIYFVCQSAECLLIVLFSPISVYLIFKGVVSGNSKKISISFLLIVFCISVYQGVIMLIYCCIFALFILFKENTNLKSKEYTRICISLILLMIGIAAVYFILNKCVQSIFRIEKSSYLVNFISLERTSFKKRFLHLGLYFYNLLFSNNQTFNELLKRIIAKVARTGWKAAEANVKPHLTANILYAPILLAFYVQIFKNKKSSVLYRLAAICILFCIIAFPIIGGGGAPLRSQYVLPFAFSFIFIYVTNSLNNYKYNLIYKVCLIVFMLCGTQQTLKISMLNYCDVMRYKSDCQLSSNISVKINSICTDPEVPVLLYGVYHPQFDSNYIKGETCGYSSFEWDEGSSITDSTYRGLSFMKTQGFNYLPVNDNSLIQKARLEAENMPDYPASGCVKNLGNVVVVRLSESSYQSE